MTWLDSDSLSDQKQIYLSFYYLNLLGTNQVTPEKSNNNTQIVTESDGEGDGVHIIGVDEPTVSSGDDQGDPGANDDDSSNQGQEKPNYEINQPNGNSDNSDKGNKGNVNQGREGKSSQGNQENKGRNNNGNLKAKDDKKTAMLGPEQIAGIVIGSVAALLLIVLVILRFKKKRAFQALLQSFKGNARTAFARNWYRLDFPGWASKPLNWFLLDKSFEFVLMNCIFSLKILYRYSFLKFFIASKSI